MGLSCKLSLKLILIVAVEGCANIIGDAFRWSLSFNAPRNLKAHRFYTLSCQHFEMYCHVMSWIKKNPSQVKASCLGYECWNMLHCVLRYQWFGLATCFLRLVSSFVCCVYYFQFFFETHDVKNHADGLRWAWKCSMWLQESCSCQNQMTHNLPTNTLS